DRNRSHWSTSKTPSYTKSVSWQHHLLSNINTGKPGRMVTNDYIVDIANRDGQLQLNVTDRKTGQTSTIQVSGLQNNSTDF
ncbi:curli assembly protein CsgF, partial [Escherichia coli]|uniref:curli assembly protein CsgF n=1 Tax=Escherichia coli TaxID=562 RepID=UPI001EC60CB8